LSNLSQVNKNPDFLLVQKSGLFISDIRLRKGVIFASLNKSEKIISPIYMRIIINKNILLENNNFDIEKIFQECPHKSTRQLFNNFMIV